MRKIPAERVLSVKQVAKMCHASRETIRRWIRKYGLPAYNTQQGMDIKILESDLRKFSDRLRVYVDRDALDDEG